VYCFGMESRKPREFISLPAASAAFDRSAGLNYAVMHNIGLTDPAPSACPPAAAVAGFSRAVCSQPGALCRVTPDRPGAFVSGMAAFKKYRLLLSPRLALDATDGTFAISWKSFVPAGRAGDCFSRLSGCSVGSFSIDLTGTDFVLDSEANVWQGENTSTMIF
uniref:GON domain-containing protein n=1 Tax=Macrostomum lignano TaxID=282301 RepID=A0A1I8HBN0_9PLAT